MSSNIFSDLIGKPFVDMARGPDCFDCWGVFLEVNRRVGNTLPDYHDIHAPEEVQEGIAREYERHRQEWEQVDTPQAGDLVVIKRMDGRGLHFGVMVDEAMFAHTSHGSGVRFENVNNPFRARLIKEILRWRITTP